VLSAFLGIDTTNNIYKRAQKRGVHTAQAKVPTTFRLPRNQCTTNLGIHATPILLESTQSQTSYTIEQRKKKISRFLFFVSNETYIFCLAFALLIHIDS
jgi:hypothetical protein